MVQEPARAPGEGAHLDQPRSSRGSSDTRGIEDDDSSGECTMSHPHTLEERWFMARTFFGLNPKEFWTAELVAKDNELRRLK